MPYLRREDKMRNSSEQQDSGVVVDREIRATASAGNDRLVGTMVAARLLGLAQRTVRDRAVEFGGCKIGPRVWKFSLAALKAYIDRRRDDALKN